MKKPSRQGLIDLWLAFITLGISIVVFWNASTLPDAPFDPLGPRAFPMAIAAALALVSVIAIARTLAGGSIGRSDVSLIQGIGGEAPADYKHRPGLAVLASVLTVGYIAAMQYTGIGFLWATVIYMTALGWAMSDRRKKDALIAIIMALASGLFVNFLFTKIFIVDLP